MNRTKSLLLISAGFLIALVFILTAKGWNNNTQVLDTSANEPVSGESEMDDEHQHSDHQHESPQNIIFSRVFDGADSAQLMASIESALNENATQADFEKLLEITGDKDAQIVDFCKANIYLSSQKWSDFETSLKSFVGESVHDDLVIQLIEPMLQKAIEHEEKPLYLNMLSDVYLHDVSNTNKFMSGIRTLKKVLELDSNNEEAIYKLAVFSVRSNQLEKAKQRFKKLISLQPENEGYRQMLEELCIETQDSTCFDDL